MDNAMHPFVTATCNVLKMMMDVDIDMVRAPLMKSGCPNINVLIRVSGAMEGTVLYSFPENMTLEMVHIMLDMHLTKVDTFVASALAEVTSIISRYAVLGLTGQNALCTIGSPVVMGCNEDLTPYQIPPAQTMPLKTSIGIMHVSVSLAYRK